MNELAGLFQYEFTRHALVAGLIVALLGAVVGFFVVLRRMAFVAVGISHAALGGVAIGVLIGHSPLAWAVAFSIAVALLMAALGRRGMAEDTAMGIFFPAAMAFGVIVISLSDNWQRDLLSYLFGNILAVNAGDLRILGVTGLVVSLLVAAFFKELMYISFDEESAHASGVPVSAMRTMLLVVTAVTVVVAIKVVGTVLVAAMLVIPAATATQLTQRWQWMLFLSMLFGVASLMAGLVISFLSTVDVATGPAAVLTATAFFAASTFIGRLTLGRVDPLALPEPLSRTDDPAPFPIDE